MKKLALAALIVFALLFSLAAGMQFVEMAKANPYPTPSESGSPLGILSFEEAVAASESYGPGKWNWGGYRLSSSFETPPLVTPDGLVAGQLEWNQNGTLFEAVYPSGQVKTMIEQFEGLNDSAEYYVWALTLIDHTRVWIDARNGNFLAGLFPRVPGLLQFDVAVRVTEAAQPKTNLWDVITYEPLANYTGRSGSYQTDGTNVGHFLLRSPDGTFTEDLIPIGPVPTIGPTPTPVLRIKVSNDTEAYNVWEIRTTTKTYYVDERDGAIRYVIANVDIPNATSTLNPSPSIPEFPSFMVVSIVMAAILAGLIISKRKQFKRT